MSTILSLKSANLLHEALDDSHMAGIYSDCRIREIIIIKVNELKTCVAV